MITETDAVTFNSPKSARLLGVFLVVLLGFAGIGLLYISLALNQLTSRGVSLDGAFYLTVAVVCIFAAVMYLRYLKQVTLSTESIVIESWVSVVLNGNRKVIIPYESVQSVQLCDATSIIARTWIWFSYSCPMIILYNGKRERVYLDFLMKWNYKEGQYLYRTLKDKLGGKVVSRSLA